MFNRSYFTAACTLLSLTLVACDDLTSSSTPNTATPRDTTPDADNTKRNEVDQSGNTKTPLDQSEKKTDIDITAEIRRAIMDAEGMSVNGQNVKIMTDAGVVTLRGPVESAAEKDRIAALATAVVGVTHVDNQLEVKVNP